VSICKGSILAIGIVSGDLLGQDVKVGFGLGVPPNVVQEDAGIVPALEFRDLRQLPFIEKAPQFHQYPSLRGAEKGSLRVGFA
jgi:hypothetical protein